MNIEQLKQEIENRKNLIRTKSGKQFRLDSILSKIGMSSAIIDLILAFILIGFSFFGSYPIVLETLITIVSIPVIVSTLGIIITNVFNERKIKKYYQEIATLKSNIQYLEKRQSKEKEIEKDNQRTRNDYNDYINRDRIVQFETTQKIKRL